MSFKFNELGVLSGMHSNWGRWLEATPISISMKLIHGNMNRGMTERPQTAEYSARRTVDEAGASAAPEGRREQHEDGEELQPPEQHRDAADPGLEVTEALVVAGRPYLPQARAGVVQGRRPPR